MKGNKKQEEEMLKLSNTMLEQANNSLKQAEEFKCQFTEFSQQALSNVEDHKKEYLEDILNRCTALMEKSKKMPYSEVVKEMQKILRDGSNFNKT